MNFLVFDIGGTYIKYGIIDQNFNFIFKNKVLTEAFKGGVFILNCLKKIGNELKIKYDFKGIAISSAGIIDPHKGRVLFASNNIPNYEGLEIKKELEFYFNVSVTIENDVNCVGLAESVIYPEKDVFAITIGTGIGGSFVNKNGLYHGSNFKAGEIGRIMFGNKSFEELSTPNSLVKNILNLNNNLNIKSAEDVFTYAKNNDIICIEEINKTMLYVAKSIAIICYLLNPDIIVIGGGVSEEKDFLLPILNKHLKNEIDSNFLNDTEVLFSKNLNDSGMIGALIHFKKLEVNNEKIFSI